MPLELTTRIYIGIVSKLRAYCSSPSECLVKLVNRFCRTILGQQAEAELNSAQPRPTMLTSADR